MSATPKFETEINLDDEDEAQEFFNKYCHSTSHAIARDLGFEGKGAAEAAQNLFEYANGKLIAMRDRREGRISLALVSEEILDSIYKDKIQPNIECW